MIFEKCRDVTEDLNLIKLLFCQRNQWKHCLRRVVDIGITEYASFLYSHSNHGNETCSEGSARFLEVSSVYLTGANGRRDYKLNN